MYVILAMTSLLVMLVCYRFTGIHPHFLLPFSAAQARAFGLLDILYIQWIHQDV